MRFSNPSSRMTSYETVAFQVLRSHFEQAEEKATLLNHAVVRLRAFDEKNGTQLTETLSVYLLSSQNVRQTAPKLGLHRNSVLQRLAKIREITEPYDAFCMDAAISLELLKSDSLP